MRDKGNSIVDFPNKFSVVDIETTGLEPSFCDIIEVAALKVVNDEIVGCYSSLIHLDDKLDPFITQLTGITDEMLADAPELYDVLPEFLDFIGDDIIIGHNVNFDINFLYDNAIYIMNTKLTNDFIDTLRIARRLLKELKHHRLKDLCSYFKINTDGMHRSLADCEATLQCYKCMKSMVSDYDSFKKQFKNRKKHSGPSSKGFTREHPLEDIDFTKYIKDEDNLFYNKVVVITGALEKMLRKDALQIVANIGGIAADSVTSKTNFLVLGNNDYCSSIKGGKSGKLKKAEELKLKGKDIEIISENVFYDIINNN